MRVIDRRGEPKPGERWERFRRYVPGTIFLLCGLLLFGIEGCVAVEAASGRARVTSAWLWIALSALGGYFLLMGLETLLIGTARLARPLYYFLAGAAPLARGRASPSIPPPRPETPGERARWRAFWQALGRALRLQR